MKKKWSRRRFLEAGLKSSIAVGAGAAGTASAWRVGRAAKPPSAFDGQEREALFAAMDAIIPPGDGMPGASDAGGLEYLDRIARETQEIRRELGESLNTLDTLSRKGYGSPFAALSSEKRVGVLKRLEKEFPKDFDALRDLVYEAYYTQSLVWRLIGYEFYATNQPGPVMKPFDEAILAEAREKPRHYREVS
jgi:hypothetical protein